ncbi:DNA double-strand break repair helicase HerA [Candidatus Tiddalikarchaeum anstoanum]|nr:DNA double-strand break repair helicase HerA [Candidatus Tiddalikarchaeum anstoanum]
MIIGKIVGGSVSDKIIIRLKSNSEIDVGDILLINDPKALFYVKVINVSITSMVPAQFIEEMAGNDLEYQDGINLFDDKDRFYRIAEAKILKIKKAEFVPPRTIPNFFSDVKKVTAEDFKFLENEGEVEVGNLRLGTDYLRDVIIKLPAKKLISHHILVSAATGKGKSNFVKVFIRGLLNNKEIAKIIIDPHAEYYGNKGMKGLSHHPLHNEIEYYTPRWNDTAGSEELKVYAEDLVPSDFHGVVELSDAQKEAMDALYKTYNETWIRTLIIDKPVNTIYEDLKRNVGLSTLFALRRRLSYTLELNDDENGLVFTLKKRNSKSVFEKIEKAVISGKTIIVDTSMLGSEAEKLLSAAIVSREFNLFRKTKQLNPEAFKTLPELLIVFEEAPRVLGIEALSHGTNVFERIAREGRKFNVGLCAITQMPSLISKEILSQMNTKIILGVPSPADRTAVIESSCQNISDEGTEIQMLDKGEAIITSPFVDFPLPVKVFHFDELLKTDANKKVASDELLGL